MRKKGSALVYVIAFAAILLVLGTVVSSAVVSTTKFNKEHSDAIDLELAAKSGLNIFKEQLISEINSVDSSNELPAALSETNSGISEFENINITKEILRSEEKENGKIIEYKYTIISRAKEIGAIAQKEKRQVISVKINGEEIKVEIKPQGIINIKGDAYLDRANLMYMDKISFGGSLNNNVYGFDKSKYTANEHIKNTDFIINQSNVNEYFKKAITIPDKTQKTYDGLEKASNAVMKEALISNKKYLINSNAEITKSIVIENSIIVIDGDLNSNRSASIILKNSILVIKNNFNLDGGINITLDQGSFIDISNNINSSDGYVFIKIDNESILNVGKAFEKTSNDLRIELNGSSKLDVNDRINSNNEVNIIINNSRLITRTGSVIGYGGNLLNIKADNSQIYIGGEVDANTCNIELYNSSNLYTSNIKINTNIALQINNSKALINKEISSNTSADIKIDNGTLVCYGKMIVGSGQNILNINNSVFIINKEIKGHTQIINLRNSVLVSIGDDVTKDGLSYDNLLNINNLSNSFIYTLQNLKSPDFIITGESNGITPSSDIMDIVKNILN